MKQFKNYKNTTVRIKGKKYKLWVADTDVKRSIGLSRVKKLPKNCGMLFVYNELVDHSFTMKNTSIPLLIIFLDSNFNIIQSFKCAPYTSKSINPNVKYRYVIEVSSN